MRRSGFDGLKNPGQGAASKKRKRYHNKPANPADSREEPPKKTPASREQLRSQTPSEATGYGTGQPQAPSFDPSWHANQPYGSANPHHTHYPTHYPEHTPNGPGQAHLHPSYQAGTSFQSTYPSQMDGTGSYPHQAAIPVMGEQPDIELSKVLMAWYNAGYSTGRYQVRKLTHTLTMVTDGTRHFRKWANVDR